MTLKILLTTYLVILTLSVLAIPTITYATNENPIKHGFTDGIWDGKRSARDSTSACEQYNSTATMNQCFYGYDSGFKKGCEYEYNHDRASYYATDGEYDSCNSFHQSMHGWNGPLDNATIDK